MSDDPLARLEARFAWLERHVVEQDKAMLALSDELRRVREELRRLRARTAQAGGEDSAEPPPPHY